MLPTQFLQPPLQHIQFDGDVLYDDAVHRVGHGELEDQVFGVEHVLDNLIRDIILLNVIVKGELRC